jgi:hypothetical protein
MRNVVTVVLILFGLGVAYWGIMAFVGNEHLNPLNPKGTSVAAVR